MSELTKTEGVVVHAVVKLLCKRMDSNPEEFYPYSTRWSRFIDGVRTHGSEADVNALDAKLQEVRMDSLHRDALDELLGNTTTIDINESSLAQAIQKAQHAEQLQQMEAYRRLQNAQWPNNISTPYPSALGGLLGTKGTF